MVEFEIDNNNHVKIYPDTQNDDDENIRQRNENATSTATTTETKPNGIEKKVSLIEPDKQTHSRPTYINIDPNGSVPHLAAIPNDDTSLLHFRKNGRAINQMDSPVMAQPKIMHISSSTGNLNNGRPAIPFHRYNSYASSLGGHSSHYAHSEHDPMIPPPSTAKEKSKMTRRYFATVFGISYSIFLVVFGAVAFIGDAVVSQYPLAQAYCIFMLSVALLYFVILYIDIRVHVQRAKNSVKERERRRQLIEEQHVEFSIDPGDGPLELRNAPYENAFDKMASSELNLPPMKPISHKYCFITGRHGEFLYLKLGAAWFAFGLLIHAILQISYQIIFLTAAVEDHLYECASIITLALEILFPIYALVILFFIFKYINIVINVYRGFARLMLMHAIGTSLAMWIYTIVRETTDAIALGEYDVYSLNPNAFENDTRLFSQVECPGPEALNTIHRNFSPYLYPFIIEFCILIVGIWYMIWANINHCPKKKAAHQKKHDSHGSHGKLTHGEAARDPTTSSVSSEMCDLEMDHHDVEYKTNTFIYADCHATSRGLLSGLVLIVLTIVFIILLFVAVSEEEYRDVGILINSIFYLTVLVIMILAVIVAYTQTAKLDINHHPMSKLDDVLLFIAIPAFFLETTFSMVPAIYNNSVMNICIIMAQIIQVLIQTPFIIDALRRCSNAPALRKKKPGRELVIFLTIANVSLWVFYTFSVKGGDSGDERYEFYGYALWSILNHISLPLIMFYRFHASVCLVDIWRHSYEPAPAEH